MKVENCDTTTNRSTGTERRGHYRQVVNAGEAYNMARVSKNSIYIGQDMEDMYNQYVLYIMFLFS